MLPISGLAAHLPGGDNLIVPKPDTLGRPFRDLRISVTDRCNYRCSYCMPFDEYLWIEKEAVLSFEEITRLARIFVGLGVEKVRLTGGEPLVRQNLPDLIAQLVAIEGLKDLSLTTNGSLLAASAPLLKKAGLDRINVSLDTLRVDRFKELTRRGDLRVVLDGVEAAKQAGLGPIKINSVIMRGRNDDEILDLAAYGRANGFGVRFIEYMDVGNANGWSMESTVRKDDILEVIRGHHPFEQLGRRDDRAPSLDYRYTDGGGDFGVIGSVTEPFCSSCSRGRLTADGRLVTCLFASEGFDLKGPLREGASDQELARAIDAVWNRRTDRYSDERWAAILKGKPFNRPGKIEMITLGG